MIKYYGYYILKDTSEYGGSLLIGSIVMEKGKQSLKRCMVAREFEHLKYLKELESQRSVLVVKPQVNCL